LGAAGAVDSVGSVGWVGVAAVGAVGALAGQPVAAVGSSDDRLGPVVVGGRDSRCTARPPRWRPRWRTAPRGGPTGTARPLTVGGEGARIERSKHRVQGLGGRLAAAVAGGGDGALADGGGVAGGHSQAVAGEGFAQRRPGGVELLGELEGALGLGAVGEEPAGLPAQVALLGRGRPCGSPGARPIPLAGARAPGSMWCTRPWLRSYAARRWTCRPIARR
jgi:hypothetical protein